ncbi:hypothetical protein P9D60_18830 [Bacillus spizizenii]|uniref:Uncharacterized protein n=1 Tax=Bacillus rugosus TaxID=2715209 RepID=A0ACD3ZX48_9BACI|nr:MULTISPECIES: hypothetical protein [Bacillus]APH66279.1 hypothetical protein BAX60_02010 [Bacillus subtilis]MBY4602454.1 hypothetical protein [Bacillus sp. SPARC3]MCY7764950.1 hypothetical protein [Bacillus inaquosorum]MCY7833725.1 hypothetical protein [Bacillus spizizenii]MCY7923058.1 hypothetical protein [Bacillus spizizenii]
MKTYSQPSLIEFGTAEELIQGCGGWGVENWSMDDSDSKYVWMTTGGRKLCICTSLSGTKCTPVL